MSSNANLPDSLKIAEFSRTSLAIFINISYNLTESSKSPASIAQSNKQWVGTCLYQEWYKPLLISCEAAIRLWASSVADCEYPLDENRKVDAITAWINLQKSQKTVEKSSGFWYDSEYEQISSHRFGGGCYWLNAEQAFFCIVWNDVGVKRIFAIRYATCS